MSKKLVFGAVMCACLAGRLAAQLPPSATATKIGIVNLQAVVSNSNEGQSASKSLQDKYGPRDKELQARKADLSKQNDQLQKGANLVSPDKQSQMLRDLNEKSSRLQRDIQDMQTDLQQDQQGLLKSIAGRLLPIVEKYAKDHSYTLVLDVGGANSPVIFATNSTDITKDILDAFNQSAPASGTSLTSKPPTSKPPVPGTPKN